jgi:hypothetical protein
LTRLPASIRILFLIVFLSCGVAVPRSQTTTPVPATPLSPITAILDAFESHRVIALSEGDHGNLQGHAFRLALVRDPRFARTVNDIVVEFGAERLLGCRIGADCVRGRACRPTCTRGWLRHRPLAAVRLRYWDSRDGSGCLGPDAGSCEDASARSRSRAGVG